MAYNLVLGAIQFLHFLIDAFVVSYVFIFNPIYDIYFVTFVLLQTMHWGALKNECFISYIEKKNDITKLRTRVKAKLDTTL